MARVDLSEPWIEVHRKKYELTKNPIWVWATIEVIASRIYSENQSDSENGTSVEEYEIPRNIEIPEWCFAYLSSSALRLHYLIGRHDCRDGRQRERIDYAQAMQMVPDALALKRKGWNAFVQFQRDAGAINAAAIHDFAILDGATGNEAMAKAWAAMGVEDQRAFRRKLSKGRKLIGTDIRRLKPKG